MTDNLVKVANKADIPANSIKAVEVNGKKIAICQAGDSFYAVADSCSHSKVALHGGQITDDEIECPKHGARFDLKTGKAMCPPAVQPISTYPLEIRDDEIWINVSESN